MELKGEALKFFKIAERYVKANKEYNIKLLEKQSLKFENQTAIDFRNQFCYVTLSSGFKNSYAVKIYQQFIDCGLDINVINHPKKKIAIAQALSNYNDWFEKLQKTKDKIEYIDSLPMMGPITKYHLARNLGLDYAKPDVHLKRLVNRFSYSDVQIMCGELAKESGYRTGAVDYILWRYCAGNPNY
jgi:hypothetical protein